MADFDAIALLYALGAAIAWVRLRRWEPAWRAALAGLWLFYAAAMVAAAIEQARRRAAAERMPLWLSDLPEDHLSAVERAIRPLARPGFALGGRAMPATSRRGLPSSFDVIEKAYGQ